MNADTTFEDRLLTALLEHHAALTTAPAVRRAPRRRGPRVRVALPAVAGLTAAALAAFLLLSTGGDRPAASPRTTVARIAPPGTRVRTSPGHAVLYRLAAASAAEPAVRGRYRILREVDTFNHQPGTSYRTSVIDTRTGASVTYQLPDAALVAEPPKLVEGPARDNTLAWFRALPTATAALRTRLLAVQRREDAANDRAMARQARSQGIRRLPAGPRPDDNFEIVEQVTDLLWNPLVDPVLRASLYRVLATCDGYTVNPHARDPLHRRAISLTVRSSLAGRGARTITWENPRTGAVLGQAQAGFGGDTEAYRPVTGSRTLPPDPYPNG